MGKLSWVIWFILVSERGRQESQCHSDAVGETLDQSLLALKIEEEGYDPRAI